MKMKAIIKTAVVVMMVVMLSATAYAKRGGGREQGPPPEAIKACEGKQEGASVTFTGRRGESLSATCKMVDGQLVAVPQGHRRR